MSANPNSTIEKVKPPHSSKTGDAAINETGLSVWNCFACSRIRPFVFALLALGSLLFFLGLCQLHAAEKRYVIFDDKPAPLDIKGWEAHSFPLGNGHFGVSYFGGVEEELWQFCEKSLFVNDPAKAENAWDRVGLSSLCELRLIQDHDLSKVTRYRRDLDLDKALGSVTYNLDGVDHSRETFASYPDRCFAARISASAPGKISFRLNALHPYLGEFRSGVAAMDGDTLVLSGEAKPYRLKYEIRIAVTSKGGTVRAHANGAEGGFTIEAADEAFVYVTLGTNYRLDSKVFLTGKAEEKLNGIDLPTAEIASRLASAKQSGWEVLKQRHQTDVARLMQRTRIDLGGRESSIASNRLLADPKPSPESARYLEELYFQFGRYLLVASSRKGTLPANLQGTWNMHRSAPWTGGYWANINVQMNYWPAFSTGLEETFEPYHEYFHAAFPRQQAIAKGTLSNWKRNPVEGAWTAGTGNSPYGASGPGSTSGAGTGPFVILPMWDWYLYTGRKDILEKMWPFLLGSSRFLSSVLKEQPDGTLLCDPSWSPENKKKDDPHVNLPGSAYDQQLVYENHRITLQVAKLLGKSDPILATLEGQLPQLSPVLIGASGQIKEFRQENAYGEFGEYNHRHISQLIGLYPGTLLTEKKEWLEAAKVSLNLRGDQSTGWAMAHRLNAWTRIKDGERCHSLLRTLLKEGTLPNLWDTHPPFQIDGNFGGTSGMADMLLQSHEGFIDLLPAIPSVWKTGSFSGIRARGGLSVSLVWKDGMPVSVLVESEGGKSCRIRMKNVKGWKVSNSEGTEVSSRMDQETGVIEFSTVPGLSYVLTPMM